MAELFSTYESTGMVQDVRDIIDIISPLDTPVYSMLRKGRASAVTHEWLTITLSTSNANSAIEGAAFATASAQTIETRMMNKTQIFTKPWQVSATIEAVKKFGRTSEYAFRRMLALKAWKIDVEFALIDNTASAAGATGTAKTFNGLPGAAGVTTTANSSSTSSSPLDEVVLNKHLQAQWDTGASPDTLVCPGFIKRTISGFVGGGAGRPIVNENGDRMASNVVDVYESDFGRLNIFPTRYGVASRLAVFQKDLCSMAFLRDPVTIDRPYDSDGRQGIVVGELTFEYLNTNAVGRIYRVQSS